MAECPLDPKQTLSRWTDQILSQSPVEVHCKAAGDNDVQPLLFYETL